MNVYYYVNTSYTNFSSIVSIYWASEILKYKFIASNPEICQATSLKPYNRIPTIDSYNVFSFNVITLEFPCLS